MYELILIAYLFNASVDGGAAVAIEKIAFSDIDLCEKARDKLISDGVFLSGGLGSRVGMHVTTAECVKVA